MTTKLVLPSVSELKEKLDAEVSMFCAHFELEIYTHSYGRWVANIQGCKIEVVAGFEKSPVMRLNDGDVKLTLPNYGESIEEVIEANWGFIKGKFPQRWYS